MQDDKLIFLLSQPRAGSTMLQSVLGGHPQIATAPEPWLMFAPHWVTREPNITPDFGHPGWRQTLNSFLDRVPGGHEAYDNAMRNMALDIYGRLAGEGFFLDKTPRYFLIVDDLMRVFPNAKFIVLFRNPLAVLMSMLATFPHPQQVAVKHASDLSDGPRCCVDAMEKYAARICRVQYEDVVTDPQREVGRICEYIGVPFDGAMIEYGNQPLPDSVVGDPNVKQHRRPTTASLDKWRQSITSKERADLCLSYLDSLGATRVQAMGYDAADLRGQVLETGRSLRSEYTFADRAKRAMSGANEIWSRIRRGHQRYHTAWTPGA